MPPSLMESPNDNRVGIRYSEDVKEAISEAQKVAQKAKSASVSDRHLLQAMLLLNRPFSRLDSLLKRMNVSPKDLNKKLRKADSTNVTGTLAETTTLLENAKQYAVDDTKNDEAAQPTVEIEHVLKALSHSNDPVVASVFNEVGITDDKIVTLIPEVLHSLSRQIMYVLRETVEVVVVVLFFLVVIKEGFGELRLIPSESMLPMLQVEDRVLIEKVTRWSVPVIHRPYERGDILVFYPPMTLLKDDPWSIFLRMTGFSGLIYKKEDNIDVAYIKRLIGLPGDKVDVRPGQGVFVNGQLLNEPYTRQIANSCTFEQPEIVCGSVVVPEGHYYMMGDNRNQSADSRYWGFEPINKVIGRAVARVWPVDRFEMLETPQYPASTAGKNSK